MACVRSQACASKNSLPISASYCQSLGGDRFIHWKKEVLSGQELVVLTVRDGCTSSSVDENLCESLATWGIRMTPDQWKILIQCAVLEPEVRKYMFYNSRAFGILIAVVVYMTLWVNLYSTLETFSLGRHWEYSILVTGVALVTALAIRLLIHWHQRQLNMNTDMRLSAANETFMKSEFLVGITDVFEKRQSIPQLWLVHFDVEPCRRSLVDALTELKRSRLAAPRQSLDKLYIVIEMPILPSQDEETAGSPLEESPLLCDPKSSGRASLARQERLRLVPDGTPETALVLSESPLHFLRWRDNRRDYLLGDTRGDEVVAQELLVIFSSYYIRLLVSGQLPKVPARRHITVGHSPCLCQFIETTLLEKKSFQLR